MIKRTIYLGSPSYVKSKAGQMVVEKEGSTTASTIPFEDIGVGLLDNAQITLTHDVLRRLEANKAVVISCDEQHMPSALMTSLHGHTLHTKIARAQMESSQVLRKQLWQQTIKQKLMNQALVLNSFDLPSERLYVLKERVLSGDTTNVEGQAAAYYWKTLLGEGFNRDRYGLYPNNMLNYGYSILRSMVARSIVASGLIPSLGLHHRNQYNPYCLADDLMEPFRPFMDYLVICITQESEESFILDKEIKSTLLSIATVDGRWGRSKRPLMVGMSYTAASFVECLSGKKRKISYPEII